MNTKTNHCIFLHKNMYKDMCMCIMLQSGQHNIAFTAY